MISITSACDSKQLKCHGARELISFFIEHCFESNASVIMAADGARLKK